DVRAVHPREPEGRGRGAPGPGTSRFWDTDWDTEEESAAKEEGGRMRIDRKTRPVRGTRLELVRLSATEPKSAGHDRKTAFYAVFVGHEGRRMGHGGALWDTVSR